MNIKEPAISFVNDQLQGGPIDRINRKIKDLLDIFYDKKAYAALPPETIVYEVESYFPVAEGTEGGLFYGITYIHPGTVGEEYFMTKGHFHKIRNRAEYYCTIRGEGMLLLMNELGDTWGERMFPGSIHFIPGHIAHRTVNTGNDVLSFSAFWPSDAGHDYATISRDGFSKILVKRNGQPELVARS